MPIQTPNMNLTQPVIGTDSGLVWEQSTNNNAGIVDGHTHIPGQGDQIPPAGLDINTDLTFQGNSATNLKATIYVAQSSVATNGAIYFKGTDLYANDLSGNSIQITSGGGVNATSSGIASGTATAGFVSSALVVNQATNTPANIKAGSYLMGNNTSGSHFLTLAPPNAMAADYTLNLPSLPVSQSVVTLDNSGNFATPAVYPLPAAAIANGAITTTQISGSAGITGGQIANTTITNANIANTTISAAKIANNTIFDQQVTGSGLTPASFNSLASGYYGDSSSVTNTFSSTGTIIQTSIGSSNANRPTFLLLGGGSVTNSAGATITLVAQVFTGVSWTTFNTMVLSASTSIAFPPGILNCIDASGLSNASAYRIQISAITGGSLTLTGVDMKVVQV